MWFTVEYIRLNCYLLQLVARFHSNGLGKCLHCINYHQLFHDFIKTVTVNCQKMSVIISAFYFTNLWWPKWQRNLWVLPNIKFTKLRKSWSFCRNIYRSGTVNSKSFVSKDFIQNKWKYELTVHFKYEMIGKHVTETSNKVELWINCVWINRARPVFWIRLYWIRQYCPSCCNC